MGGLHGTHLEPIKNVSFGQTHRVVEGSNTKPGGQLLHVLLAVSRIAPAGQPMHYCPFQIGAREGHVIHLMRLYEKCEPWGHYSQVLVS